MAGKDELQRQNYFNPLPVAWINIISIIIILYWILSLYGVVLLLLSSADNNKDCHKLINLVLNFVNPVFVYHEDMTGEEEAAAGKNRI